MLFDVSELTCWARRNWDYRNQCLIIPKLFFISCVRNCLAYGLSSGIRNLPCLIWTVFKLFSAGCTAAALEDGERKNLLKLVERSKMRDRRVGPTLSATVACQRGSGFGPSCRGQ
jgi:hypothetical protein